MDAEISLPEFDPPSTVRVHPDDDPADPGARRVVRVKIGGPAGWMRWVAMTGIWPDGQVFANHVDVTGWPIQHPLGYTAALRPRTAGQLG